MRHSYFHNPGHRYGEAWEIGNWFYASYAPGEETFVMIMLGRLSVVYVQGRLNWSWGR